MKNRPKPKPKYDRHTYFRALVDETLQDLGRDVYHFRNLRKSISKSELGKDINQEILFLLDGIYQTVLDNIIDGLANANDLRVGHIAIEGLEKSVRVKRGFCKKSEVL